LPGARDPLLDQPAAEIGVDQTPLGSGNGVGQPVVGDLPPSWRSARTIAS
jgi:hypothetical protein